MKQLNDPAGIFVEKNQTYFRWRFIAALFVLVGLNCSDSNAQITPIVPDLMNSDATVDATHDTSPEIATDGDGTWIAAWQGGGDSYLISTDNGQTWLALNGISVTTGGLFQFVLQPRVIMYGNERVGIVSYGRTDDLDWDICYVYSADNGATWSDPIMINDYGSTDSSNDISSDVAADNNGTVVVTWHSKEDLNGRAGTDIDIFYSRSTDHGATWSASAVLNSYGTTDSAWEYDPVIATDGYGNFMVAWETAYDLNGTIGTDRDIVASASTDYGATWSDPAPLNAALEYNADSSVQIHPYGIGKWMAVWEHGAFSPTRKEVVVARSEDNGATWTSPIVVESNAGLYYNGTDNVHFDTDGDGTWVVVWEPTSDLSGENFVEKDIYYSISTDNGDTWTIGAPIDVNAGADTGDDENPDVVSDGMGNWILSWESDEDLAGAGTDNDIFFTTFTFPVTNSPPEEMPPELPIESVVALGIAALALLLLGVRKMNRT